MSQMEWKNVDFSGMTGVWAAPCPRYLRRAFVVLPASVASKAFGGEAEPGWLTFVMDSGDDGDWHHHRLMVLGPAESTRGRAMDVAARWAESRWADASAGDLFLRDPALPEPQEPDA